MESIHRDPASNQLLQQQAAKMSSSTSTSPSMLVTSNGAPVDTLTASMTATSNGPIVLQDFVLLDHLSHFDRERIPERVVHAKGAGALGYFVVTQNQMISQICKSKLFDSVGKVTPVTVRFSTVGGESGSADSVRDPRGFAIKFFTEEGIWDLVGNNTPIFFIRDPILFPSFIHTQKRNPSTHLKDPDAFWDFIGLRPETTHQVSFLFSDRGTPDGYRHMNGYGSHTFKNVNHNGQAVYVKYHLKTDQGIRNLDAMVADRLAAEDPDYAIRDLYNAIERGEYPSWTMYVQVMTYEQAAAASFNPFDLTKIWSHKDYPLHEVGRLYLNQNPVDYFAQVEQLAFAPSHLIPGIEPSPDKMLQARLFSYPDTHRHRLGANYQQLPCNSVPPLVDGTSMSSCPYATGRMAAAGHYQRDGPMQMTLNGSGAPNYFPNSFQGPTPHATAKWHVDTISSGQVDRVETGDSDNFTQVGAFFRSVLTDAERQRLTDNIAGHLCQAQAFIRKRVIHNFSQADPMYGRMIADKVDALLLSQQQREKKNASYRQSPTSQSAARLNPPRSVPPPAPPRLIASNPSCPYRYGSKL